jgi:hypothetical protein
MLPAYQPSTTAPSIPGIKPIHPPFSGQGHQGDIAFVAGFKAHGGPGGDVEAHTASPIAVKAGGRR